MSLFLLHQIPEYTILLADSVARRRYTSRADSVSINLSKLVNLKFGTFASHAGTWQPAWAVLSDIAKVLAQEPKIRGSFDNLCAKCGELGTIRLAEYRKLFNDDNLDVRIVLVLTGEMRAPLDIDEGYSTTVLLMESAREMAPLRIRGALHFAANPQLTQLATDTLGHDAFQELRVSTPLAAGQALLATHAMLARLSDNISLDANLVLIGREGEFNMLTGEILNLPCEVLIGG
jgi:hypothetical protein